MHVAITGQRFIFSAHASYLNSNWAIHLYESVDETIVDIIYIIDSTPFSEGYAKVVYCGGGYDIYEFASPDDCYFYIIHISGGRNGVLAKDYREMREKIDKLSFINYITSDTTSYELVVNQLDIWGSRSSGDHWRFEKKEGRIYIYVNGECEGTADRWDYAQYHLFMKYYPFDMW